jgi:hypothetical protein
MSTLKKRDYTVALGWLVAAVGGIVDFRDFDEDGHFQGPSVLDLNTEKANGGNLLEIRFVKELAIFFIFEQMLAKLALVAADQKLELF